MSDYLHIVCLDAPAPPNYGGAIDMFYKIRALAQSGKKIILHYFDYRPNRNAEGIGAECEAVYAYKRKSFKEAFPVMQPFIVKSRINRELIKRLNEDRHPVLLEGLHCAGLIPYLNDLQRVVLRMHNDEAAYYHHLAQAEKSFLKKAYFLRESRLLKSYQQGLEKGVRLACLSKTDLDTFRDLYGFRSVGFISCFIPWQELNCNPGNGDYCLYHGNMSVSENEEAAVWLLKEVFSKTDTPLVIAGSGISPRLKKMANANKNVSLVSSPTIAEINALIQNAHINVLPSMNNTGVKLKLLHALTNGRHCLTNEAGIAGSNIEAGVIVENNPVDWIDVINRLMKQDFTSLDIALRQPVLNLYNNRQNAKRLSEQW